MAAVELHHNPRCSKSREALQLIRDRGIEPVIVDYLAGVHDRASLTALLARLALPPSGLLRRGEPEAPGPDADEDAILDALVAHPRLIERPVVVTPRGAVVARPPERLLPLLDRL
ncbi:MAG TPA: arsenate reductase (glutaredoxin) [Brevundimonas sp.]|jgi:arsenate reductase|uniref:arsenate reductase (glutaredoxin) n=1 Tax=Brevundimonas sp. TaxID=1871086 RepID=UPI002DF2C9B4|nr:arsenate reductase (glutaredoxin) [Brevundimonas sp.]HEV2081312.1 arsenate reductase (glutaredoxin) [Brevundimonas sp.]